nr:MAG TPA: hypothetical protein [Caudoviricetes sp.]
MQTLSTYLTALRDKVFKLLPMREDYDNGEDNHLEEYLENLCANYAGAFDCYPELKAIEEIVEVRNNIIFLKNNSEIEFAKWRSMILRSTRLIQSVALRYEEV